MYAELFDGTRLEFPDGTDPSVISATAKKVTQSLSAGQPSTQSHTGAVADELGRYDAAKQPTQTTQLPPAVDAGFSAKDTAIALAALDDRRT